MSSPPVTSLRECDLSQRQLQCIPRTKELDDAKTIGVLVLSQNPQLQLDSNIGAFSNLHVLLLSFCGLTNLPDELRRLQALERLDVDGNNFGMMPDVITTLANLKVLNMGICQILELPASLVNLKRLLELHLANNQLSYLPDGIGKLTSLKILDVTLNRLTRLPDSIGDLNELVTLNLKANVIQQLPESMSNLIHLKDLFIGQNLLGGSAQITQQHSLPTLMVEMRIRIEQRSDTRVYTRKETVAFRSLITKMVGLQALDVSLCGLLDLPEELANLTKLERLSIDCNPFRTFPPVIAKFSRLTILNMVQCELREVPHAIADLSSLTILNVSMNKLSVVPDFIGRLVQLSELRLLNNEITSLPNNLASLSKLTVLDVSANKLSKLPTGIGGLEKLVLLSLADNLLTVLPETIGNLSALSHLELSRNAITQLPKTIGKLSKLTFFGLSQYRLAVQIDSIGIPHWVFSAPPNVLTSLPENFGHFLMLSTLNLSGNNLKELPSSMKCLVSLQILNLSCNHLASIPDGFKDLQKLEYLDISGNQEITLFPSVISKLHSLRILNIAFCNISELPNKIILLRALTHIFAGNNRFDSFPIRTLKMKSLTALDLSNNFGGISANRITELPVDLAEKPASLQILNVSGNALKLPPEEICVLGLPAIRQYLKDFRKGGRPFCDDSIYMLGDTGAGKSSLVMTLKENKPCATNEEDRTRVLQQDFVKIGDYNVNINDFGGHEIYQAVLPIFLPPKGLGILAYDLSHSWEVQKNKVRRWMTTVISRSPGMHLIVVGTHVDLLDESVRAEKTNAMQAFVKDTFAAARAEYERLILNNERKSTSSCYGKEYSSANAFSSEDLKKFFPSTSTASEASTGPPQRNYEDILKQNLRDLKSSSQVVLSFSCKEAGAGDGIEKLTKVITEKINRGGQMPHSWIKFMESLLGYRGSDALTCLSMGKVRSLAGPISEQPEALVTILRYLASTSQIIWLEGRQKLADYIFHRIEVVLNICKAVLHHSLPSDNEMLADDFRKYNTGLITDTLLKHLLKEYEQGDDIARELLQTFNVLCRGYGNASLFMIIPCRLHDDEVEVKSNVNLEDALTNILPIVHVKIKFFTSIIPHALFETSLASLLNDISASGKAEPVYWRNGLWYEMDSLKLRYERIENGVEVRAVAGPDGHLEDLWKEMHYLLGLIAKYILDTWPGAMPTVRFICPTNIYTSSNQENDAHGRETDIKELRSNEEPKVSKFFSCTSCGQWIPRAFLFNCKPEHLGPEDLKIAKDFLEKLRAQKIQCENPAECIHQPDLIKRFKTARLKLAKAMDRVTVLQMVDELYGSEIITRLQKEEIEAKATAYEMARAVIDKVEDKGHSAIATFLTALSSDDCGRKDLAQSILEKSP